MGIRDLFKKKEQSEADIVVAKIQMVDAWIVQKNKSYKIQFDTTVPMEAGRKKEYSYAELKEKYISYEIEIEDMMAEYNLDVDMYSLYEMHKWMQVYGSTVFWLITFAPSTDVKRYVMFDEAVAYFYDVFMRTETLCAEISQRIRSNQERLLQEEKTVYIDYQDLENCKRLMSMMAQLYAYFDFLLNLSADIYANASYLFDSEGTYIKIENVEKTFSNILRTIHSENRDAGCITQEMFLELVE